MGRILKGANDEGVRVTGQPRYFGPPERRRFAMIHRPDGPVRGAVMLCPPLGYEAVCAHAALRDLADDLAGHGLLVLRIEYDGTGNAVGNDAEPGRVRAWLDSTADAVDVLVEAGFADVTLVGVRLGATLAANVAAERPEVRRLVLWDPTLSGRRHVRALRLMAATSATTHDGSGVTVAGIRFTDETLADLGRLRIDADALPYECLVVQPREGTEAWPEIAGRGGVTVRVLPGTPELLDTDVELATVPVEIVQAIREWVVGRAAGAAAVDVPVELPGTSATADELVDEVPIVHEGLRIGADDLFATVTRPAAETPRRAVVMLNNGAAPQLGPGRAWVEWTRSLAAEGYLVCRLDLSGLGDSAPASGSPHHESYPLTAGREIAQAVEHVRGRGAERVAVLGLCSGALLGFDALLATDEVDAVVAINPRFDKPWTHRWRDRAVRAGGRTPRLIAIPLRKGPLFPVFDRLPRALWQLLDMLHLVASPTRALHAVAGHHARVLLVFGTREWGLRALRRRSGPDFAERMATGQFELAEVDGLDHSMFDLDARDRTHTHVRGFLDRQLAVDPVQLSAGVGTPAAAAVAGGAPVARGLAATLATPTDLSSTSSPR